MGGLFHLAAKYSNWDSQVNQLVIGIKKGASMLPFLNCLYRFRMYNQFVLQKTFVNLLRFRHFRETFFRLFW